MSNSVSQMHWVAFSEPKHGSAREEYEDACAGNPSLGRFAVADGATESSYAGLWARMLVEEFVSTPSLEPSAWATWLPQIQTHWELAVGHQPLPWYAEIKRQQGAFATFLGVVVQPPRWQALAVGDSCLFHVRGRALCEAFPVTCSEDFSNTPWLIGSRGFTADMMGERELRREGEFQRGDRLWLMTDALAQWFLQLTEAGHQPWDLLEPLLAMPDAAGSFRAWIAALRGAHQIRNDDVTLMGVWSG
jgi:hypothetical protein